MQRSTRPSDPRLHLALVVVQVCFGLWPVIGKSLFSIMTPTAVAGVRILFSAPLIFVAFALRSPWPDCRTLGQLALVAFPGFVVNQLAYVHGVALAGPFNAALFNMMIPLFTAVFALALGAERLPPKRWVGMGIALFGIVLLFGLQRFETSDRSWLGSGLLVLNVSSYSIFLVMSRPLIGRLGPAVVSGWLFLFAALEMGPFVIADVLAAPWGSFDAVVYAKLAFIVFGATIATYGLNAFALSRAESSLVAVYVNLQPLVTALSAWIILDALPTPRMMVAAAFIVAGVFVATRPSR